MKEENRFLRELERVGCTVWKSFFKRIEEIYAMSDCYVFPVKSEKNAIQLPLSVLEAMACNLPVITTKFGALPYVFTEGNGLFFVEKDDDFLYALDEIKMGLSPNTRGKVSPLSWTNLTVGLEKIYKNLLKT
jgi:glycosyltransferase involved in cell wall biosynthesis